MSIIGSLGNLFQGNAAALNPRELPMRGPREAGALDIPAPTSQPAAGASFGEMVDHFVSSVDGKISAAAAEKGKVLSGDSTNLHQAMISMQEASVSFSLMVEVRNKLVESYQELMRMQV